jgi:transcriptional regulator with XRE-family HTH domain
MGTLRKLLAENIKTYRKERGISQAKLAEMANTSPNYIAMIETEKRFPTDTTLERIARALGKEPFELFSVTPYQKYWEKELLVEIENLITSKLEAAKNLNV